MYTVYNLPSLLSPIGGITCRNYEFGRILHTVHTVQTYAWQVCAHLCLHTFYRFLGFPLVLMFDSHWSVQRPTFSPQPSRMGRCHRSDENCRRMPALDMVIYHHRPSNATYSWCSIYIYHVQKCLPKIEPKTYPGERSGHVPKACYLLHGKHFELSWYVPKDSHFV